MASKIKDVLLEVLGGERLDKTSLDESVKDMLVESLEDEHYVMDAMFEESKKRPRGRPRKDDSKDQDKCRARDPSKCWKYGVGKAIMKEEAKRELRNKNKLNPQPTEDFERELDLDAALREVGWDINDVPDNKNDTEDMQKDLDNLRMEAEMKKLDDNFKAYANYRQKWKEYGEAIKDAKALHKYATRLLGKHKYDEVEGVLKQLKNLPQMILDKYQEILGAYDECCEALCKVIDSKSQDKSVDSPEFSEEAKQGFGMMERETTAGYQKRMKKLGRVKEIPETIKKIDEIVAQTERRWRSVAGVSEEEFKVIKDNWQKTIGNLMKRCSLATNRGMIGVNGVLEGHLKSQHDLAKKGERYNGGNRAHHTIVGGDVDDVRYRFSQKCFGIERGLKESKYEKYGCLHTLNPRKDDNYMGGQYGRNVIRWKPQNVVATMTFTDSLCLSRSGLNYINPCLVTSPSPCCFNPENREIVDALKKKPLNIGLDSLCSWFGAPYCELQLHGEDQYDASAIASISFGSVSDVKNLSMEAREKIHEHEIPLYIGDEPIELGRDGRVHTLQT